ncbi:MAG: LCP family protein [Micrococcales bacterium]|nr:LCP family protein [Micrococcales bacterium]
METEHDTRRADRRSSRKALAGLLVLLVLLPLAAVAGYVGHLDRTAAGNIKREQLLPSAPGEEETATGAATAGATPTPGRSPAANSPGMDYLVIGSDARPGDAASRSDVMVLVHVPRDRSKVYMVHIPRDLYVDIPGRGKDKLNAAYAYGGARLLVSTIQDLYGVRIDHVAKTDFEGFKKMTDAVGGVDIDVAEASPGFPTGRMHMDGEQALAFVRERYSLSEGDISRGQRQQAFLKAMLMKAVSPSVLLNPSKFSAFVDATTDNLVVDEGLTMSKVRSEALKMRSIRGGDVVFLTSPYAGFGTGPGGASIVQLDKAKTAALGKALATDSMSSYTP